MARSPSTAVLATLAVVLWAGTLLWLVPLPISFAETVVSAVLILRRRPSQDA